MKQNRHGAPLCLPSPHLPPICSALQSNFPLKLFWFHHLWSPLAVFSAGQVGSLEGMLLSLEKQIAPGAEQGLVWAGLVKAGCTRWQCDFPNPRAGWCCRVNVEVRISGIREEEECLKVLRCQDWFGWVWGYSPDQCKESGNHRGVFWCPAGNTTCCWSHRAVGLLWSWPTIKSESKIVLACLVCCSEWPLFPYFT